MKCITCGKIFIARGKVNGCSIKCRLLNKININEECWEWTGFIAPNGYGKLSFKKKDEYAHRLSYRSFIGEIPENKLVCHTCDNRKCINPEHLWVGSAKENTVDACKKGKMKGWIGKKHSIESLEKMRKPHNIDRKGQKHHNSIFKDSDIFEIRNMLKTGLTHKEIAIKYNVHRTTISGIRSGKSWSHI